MNRPSGAAGPSIWIPIVLLAVLCLSLLPAACGKSPDQTAYEDVVATMSLRKAQRFFAQFPQSRFRDRLVDDVIGWCRREDTLECWRMVREVVPGDHPRHREAAAEYDRRIGGR